MRAVVSVEDRADLMGHKTRRISSHYSAAEIGNLVDASNLILEGKGGTMTLLRVRQ